MSSVPIINPVIGKKYAMIIRYLMSIFVIMSLLVSFGLIIDYRSSIYFVIYLLVPLAILLFYVKIPFIFRLSKYEEIYLNLLFKPESIHLANVLGSPDNLVKYYYNKLNRNSKFVVKFLFYALPNFLLTIFSVQIITPCYILMRSQLLIIYATWGTSLSSILFIISRGVFQVSLSFDTDSSKGNLLFLGTIISYYISAMFLFSYLFWGKFLLHSLIPVIIIDFMFGTGFILIEKLGEEFKTSKDPYVLKWYLNLFGLLKRIVTYNVLFLTFIIDSQYIMVDYLNFDVISAVKISLLIFSIVGALIVLFSSLFMYFRLLRSWTISITYEYEKKIAYSLIYTFINLELYIVFISKALGLDVFNLDLGIGFFSNISIFLIISTIALSTYTELKLHAWYKYYSFYYEQLKNLRISLINLLIDIMQEIAKGGSDVQKTLEILRDYEKKISKEFNDIMNSYIRKYGLNISDPNQQFSALLFMEKGIPNIIFELEKLGWAQVQISNIIQMIQQKEIEKAIEHISNLIKNINSINVKLTKETFRIKKFVIRMITKALLIASIAYAVPLILSLSIGTIT